MVLVNFLDIAGNQVLLYSRSFIPTVTRDILVPTTSKL